MLQNYVYICNRISFMNLSKKTHKHKHPQEQLSIILSLACAIHCMLTPILVLFLPMAGAFVQKYHWLEYIIILSVIVLGTSSMMHGFKYHHKNLVPVYLFIFGVLFLMIGSAIPFLFLGNDILHHVISMFGGIICSIAQFYNFKLSR